MFKLFRKKRGKTMALNQEELEKLKGLSKEDKDLLIKSLQEETVEATEVEETVEEVEQVEEPKVVEVKEVKEVKNKTKEVKEVEPIRKPVTEVGGEKGNTWEEAIKRLQEDSDAKIAKLEKELEDVKKRQPKGFDPQPNPNNNDLDDETARRKKYTSNRW